MTLRLVACSSCSNYVKAEEPQCIVCGARLEKDGGGVARTAGAVLMGLSLTACPTDDTSGDSMMSDGTMSPATESSTQGMTESMSGASMTGSESETMGPGSSGSDSGSTTNPGTDSTTFAGESAYGVGATTIEDTDTDTETTTGTTADTLGSTSVSPDYGVPD
jgi:hypothetical protein